MSQGLNRVTAKLEELGLVILKDENGKYVTRGNRNIKINGENIKPILAEAVKAQKNVKVINHVNITDYITEQDKVTGAYGFDVNEKIAYIFLQKQFYVRPAERQDFTARTIRDFQDTRCGIRRLTPERDTRWEF